MTRQKAKGESGPLSWVPSFIPVPADGLPGLLLSLAVNLAWAVIVVIPVLLLYGVRGLYRRKSHVKCNSG